MMTDIILQILISTVSLSLCGCIMLLFRRIAINGCGSLLKRLWAVVLLVSVMPMYLLPITLPERLRRQIVPNDLGMLGEQTMIEQWQIQRNEVDNKEVLADVRDVLSNVETVKEGEDFEPVPREKSRKELYTMEWMILSIWAIGAGCFFLKCQYDKSRFAKGLERSSSLCRDTKMHELLDGISKRIGIKRSIQLMVVCTEHPFVSPCLVGFFRPRVYIHADYLNEPLQTEEILAHELQHLRAGDAIYKNLTCVALALHWFNPITYWIMPRIFEDCELSCDRRTVKTLGEERRISYMKTILSIASTVQKPNGGGRAAHFFCEPSGKQTMKRRFRNLTDGRLRHTVRIIALLLAIVMTFACVGCQLIGKKKGTLHLLTPLTEEIVRFYYGLSLEDEITQEMLDGVTSLHIYRDMTVVDAVRRAESEGKINAADELPFKGQRYTIEEIGDFIIVDFEVNYKEMEGESFAAARNQALSTKPIGCMNYIHRNYMETVILPKVQSEFEGYVDYNNKLNGEFRYKQFKAYWVLKDQNILTSDRQKLEIIAAFPGCGAYPYYVFDPTGTTEERMRAYIYYAHAGLLTNRIIDTDKIDPAIFDVFPNLTNLKITGLTEIKK